ncbi:AAA family ATPase, partial [Chryseobacterium sp. ISL-6]|uniref:AAA family ATPase n=1 Tax=Chryseobacterium sp. ISL-6 TaxID=2819143 RepID=UPI001BEAEDA4
FILKTYNKAGSRESFRREAINPFVEYGIIEKNPDNPYLSKNSPATHYAISYLTLNTIKKYKTAEWSVALENFIRYNDSYSKIKESPSILIKTLQINSYKSIVNDTIELGRFNVFIGINGCGKTNILEALATVGAERGSDLNFDGLYSRGVRIARPDLILSSFFDSKQKSSIDVNLSFESNGIHDEYRCSLSPTNLNDIYTKWINLAEEELYPEVMLNYFTRITKDYPGISGDELLNKANEIIEKNGLRKSYNFDNLLSDFAIFDLNTKSLRGITQSESKKTPVGINGEGLDLLIANFSKSELEQLKKCFTFFDWLKEIITDKEDKYKLLGLKPGRSLSTLYFKDKYMQGKNNMFSAENSNEGILHVLFYLALFISNRTPKLFAIDNIETALNPRLCQVLISELTKLSENNGKQVLITTHNPAILDGLNLFDDNQRLFEVYRDGEGKTKTRRIKFKQDLSDKKFKLSEMWLKGLLGAVPKNF